MSNAALFNILINQGATFSGLTFILRNTVVLVSDAVLGAITLNVSPLQYNITGGSTLTFGTTVVTLSANATAGDRTLSVNATSAALTKGAIAKGDPIDLTGKSARAHIRKTFADTTPAATFTCTIVNPPTLGQVQLSLSSAITTGLVANINPDRVDEIADLQAASFPSSAETKLFLPGASPYRWDLEIVSGTAPNEIVTRYVYGFVLVTSEATK
jgi:hypothetical protein